MEKENNKNKNVPVNKKEETSCPFPAASSKKNKRNLVLFRVYKNLLFKIKKYYTIYIVFEMGGRI